MSSTRVPKSIAVVGAGTMGSGIAQLAARHGCVVHLIDVDQSVVTRGVAGIAARLDRSVEKGKIAPADRDAILSRIYPAGEISGLSEVELAIEAVVEDLGVKHKVFAALERAASPSTILATNTSSLSVSKIAEGVSDAARVVGMHFFNPAPIMPLVEIISGRRSSAAAVDAAYDTARSWGKTPVRAKDTPGFIVNRVARGFYLEALRLLDEGVGGVDEIDQVMRSVGGFRMGPFELMDLVGLDVNLTVSTSVWQQMGKPARLAPHAIQQELVAKGHLGRKTGRGFYSYADGHAMPAYPVDRRSFDLPPLLRSASMAFTMRSGATDVGITEAYVFCRILSAVIAEAGLALSDEVASSEDIDTAMMKGTNYPKGPLAWAEQIGHRTVCGVLKNLNDVATDRRFEIPNVFRE